jgi:hypothetical protein
MLGCCYFYLFVTSLLLVLSCVVISDNQWNQLESVRSVQLSCETRQKIKENESENVIR